MKGSGGSSKKRAGVAEAALARQIVDAPFMLKTEGIHKKSDDWLLEIIPTAAGGTLKSLLAEFPKAAALLAGLAEYSPYLWGLVTEDPKRLLTLLQCDPEKHFGVLLAKTETGVGATTDQTEVM